MAGSPPCDALEIHNAFVDSVPAKDGLLLLQSLHNSDCTMLVLSAMVRCHNCTKLKERLCQKNDQVTTPSGSAYTRNINLSTPEKLQKLARLQVEQTVGRKKITTLENSSKRIEALCIKDSISVDPALDQDISEIMEGESNSSVQQALPDGSFRKLFWQQLLNACKCCRGSLVCCSISSRIEGLG